MPIPPYVSGLPGVRSTVTAEHRLVFRQGWESYLAGGKIIDGSESRDAGNTGHLSRLRAGKLMGKITATGLYAPSVVGVLTAAYTSGGTELTVSAATAVEMDRIAGQSGTAEFVAIGPPSAAGTVAVTDVSHSAINTSTGAITVTDLAASKVVGTLIARKDGRQTPLTLIPDGYPWIVADGDGNSIDVYFDAFPIAGVIDPEQIIDWPADTSIQAWIRTNLSTVSGGKFTFSDVF
jgi:hypothetical protein